MFKLEQYPLDFSDNQLAPYMSKETINCHYGKHLATYISNLNSLINATDYQGQNLEDIILKSATDSNAGKIFNNAAQVFNHNFFFKCLTDKSSNAPDEITTAFGSLDNFIAEFKASALAVFGSGWTWLVKDNGALKIINTANADTPVAHNMIPVLTLDVWEHAYYLDHQNKRADFIDTFFAHLVNWDFVSENLKK